jgi:hypothetical protein
MSTPMPTKINAAKTTRNGAPRRLIRSLYSGAVRGAVKFVEP